MLIKLGVYGTDKLHPAMRLVLKYVPEVWGEEPVITSCAEGTHCDSSYHYFHCALDFRFPKKDVDKKIEDLRELLGDDYDVVKEATHIHVEYNL